jgi:hypothetical protein
MRTRRLLRRSGVLIWSSVSVCCSRWLCWRGWSSRCSRCRTTFASPIRRGMRSPSKFRRSATRRWLVRPGLGVTLAKTVSGFPVRPDRVGNQERLLQLSRPVPGRRALRGSRGRIRRSPAQRETTACRERTRLSPGRRALRVRPGPIPRFRALRATRATPGRRARTAIRCRLRRRIRMRWSVDVTRLTVTVVAAAERCRRPSAWTRRAASTREERSC